MSARSLNRVTLIGNLTRDPEVRYTPSGTAVCTFGVATNRSWTPSDGSEAQEETEFHRIVAWSKLAEICGQLLFKGRKIYCEGRLQTRKWTGQDGNERVTTEIVIDNMIALSPPKGGSQGSYQDVDDYGQSEDTSESAPADFTGSSAGKPAGAVPSVEPKPEKEEDKSQQEGESKVDVDDIPF